MCAECHSTNLQKGYDPKTGTFNTTWSEINVSCEACHNGAKQHIAQSTPDESGQLPLFFPAGEQLLVSGRRVRRFESCFETDRFIG